MFAKQFPAVSGWEDSGRCSCPHTSALRLRGTDTEPERAWGTVSLVAEAGPTGGERVGSRGAAGHQLCLLHRAQPTFEDGYIPEFTFSSLILRLCIWASSSNLMGILADGDSKKELKNTESADQGAEGTPT